MVRAADPATGTTYAEPVTALIRHSGLHTMVAIAVDGGGVLQATDHHLFYDATFGTYVNAIDLRVGDQLLEPDGQRVTVESLAVRQADLTAYNLTVADEHTYYVEAGSTPVLVHNDGGVCPVAAMTAAGKASYQTLIDALSRVRAIPVQLRALLSPDQLAAGIEEPICAGCSWDRSSKTRSPVMQRFARTPKLPTSERACQVRLWQIS